VVKILERLVLPSLSASLQLSDSQHGFRPMRSTITALLPLVTDIAHGFNQAPKPSRTIATAIDISKAFDTVNHTLLLDMIGRSALHSNITRWMTTYLRGRASSCSYQNQSSKYRNIHIGVPQGSVISPVLFNFFVSDFPMSAPLTTSYADDFTIAISGPKVPPLERAATEHLTDVAAWSTEKQLTIAPTKSHTTLFTSQTQQSHHIPDVHYGATQVELKRRHKILGVTLDTHLTFTPHITTVATNAAPRLRIMKALAGTSWGHHKESQLVTYRSMIRPLFTYAAPIWFPNSSSAAIRNLQSIQNSALRIATGSHKMAFTSHLHAETNTLPVSDHLSLLCSQFLASALRPHHPSFPTVTSLSGPRHMKHTLQSRFLPSLVPYLHNGTIRPDSYRQTIKALHTAAVTSAIAAQDVSKVLNQAPPPIDPSELELPRRFRTTLSQLRSGYSSSLRSFQARLGRHDDPLCPDCHTLPHTTAHIFDCPLNPTNLTINDLWERPREVAWFLAGLPTMGLPPLPRPQPEPPPAGPGPQPPGGGAL
jgi:hypothetical protein